MERKEEYLTECYIYMDPANVSRVAEFKTGGILGLWIQLRMLEASGINQFNRKQIARLLGFSKKTIDRHMKELVGRGWLELYYVEPARAFQKDGWQCEYCGQDCGVLQEHHIIPKASGGSDDSDNLIQLCPTCHKVIHTKHFRFKEYVL